MPRSKLTLSAKLLPAASVQSDVLEYRDGAERAAYLHLQYHYTIRALARFYRISKTSIARAIVALRDGRSVGVRGRPRAIPDHGEAFLVEKIIASYDQLDSLSVTEVLGLVSPCVSSALIFVLIVL